MKNVKIQHSTFKIQHFLGFSQGILALAKELNACRFLPPAD
jgi:hypothetical protein